MTTVIRATKEHHDTLERITNALETIRNSRDRTEIAQCNAILDECFDTLNRLAAEKRLWETIRKEEGDGNE